MLHLLCRKLLFVGKPTRPLFGSGIWLFMWAYST